MLAGLREESELWLHFLRLLRLGPALRLPVDDAGLLGEPVPTGSESLRPLAHGKSNSPNSI